MDFPFYTVFRPRTNYGPIETKKEEIENFQAIGMHIACDALQPSLIFHDIM